MNLGLWVVQALLAVAYLFAGVMKARQPIETLGKSMHWVNLVPVGFVRFVGIAEMLGAIGLILPILTGILPWLTIAAAVGLVLVQIGAAYFHLSRRELSVLPINLILLILAAFVVYGRIALVPA
ncbi:MAG TPA: DoxX family protein [Chloroflexota bacterium]|nr:DoxX family protein [Chloroflexota bacterium]